MPAFVLYVNVPETADLHAIGTSVGEMAAQALTTTAVLPVHLAAQRLGANSDILRLQVAVLTTDAVQAELLVIDLHVSLGTAAAASASLGVPVLGPPTLTPGEVPVPYPSPPRPELPPRAPSSLPPPLPPAAAAAPPPRATNALPFAAIAGVVAGALLLLLCFGAAGVLVFVRGRVRLRKAQVNAPNSRRSPRAAADADDEIEMTPVQPSAEGMPRSASTPSATQHSWQLPTQPAAWQREERPHALERLRLEIDARRSDPTLQPPAWEHFLRVVYAQFPPPALTVAECAAELQALSTVHPMSNGVLRALRRSLQLYHPDKNRVGTHGEEWVATAEDVTKLATMLLNHYRARISTSSSRLEVSNAT